MPFLFHNKTERNKVIMEYHIKNINGLETGQSGQLIYSLAGSTTINSKPTTISLLKTLETLKSNCFAFSEIENVLQSFLQNENY